MEEETKKAEKRNKTSNDITLKKVHVVKRCLQK